MKGEFDGFILGTLDSFIQMDALKSLIERRTSSNCNMESMFLLERYETVVSFVRPANVQGLSPFCNECVHLVHLIIWWTMFLYLFHWMLR